MRLLFAGLVALLLTAVPVQAQTPCDGPRSDALFILPPEAPGATYVFSYRTVDVPTLVGYELRLYRANALGQPQGSSVTQQSVTTAVTTAIGVMQDDATQTCYSLPVIPITQIPRGVALVATLIAVGDQVALNSLESEPSNPLALRLGAPAIRVKP